MRCEVKCGVPQGSVLGALLWDVAFDSAVRNRRPHGCTIVCYADDTLIVAIDRDWRETRRAAETCAVEATRDIEDGLTVNAAKTGDVVGGERQTKDTARGRRDDGGWQTHCDRPANAPSRDRVGPARKLQSLPHAGPETGRCGEGPERVTSQSLYPQRFYDNTVERDIEKLNRNIADFESNVPSTSVERAQRTPIYNKPSTSADHHSYESSATSSTSVRKDAPREDRNPMIEVVVDFQCEFQRQQHFSDLRITTIPRPQGSSNGSSKPSD